MPSPDPLGFPGPWLPAGSKQEGQAQSCRVLLGGEAAERSDAGEKKDGSMGLRLCPGQSQQPPVSLQNTGQSA